MAITVVPHLRLSLLGTLPSNEQFSVNLSLRPTGTTMTQFLDWLSGSGNSIADNNFADLVTDCTAFWARTSSQISHLAVLKRVKLAAVDNEGHYSAPPREAAVNQQGNAASITMPHQIARKVTLETDGDLGRIKGGFYLPGVSFTGYDEESDLTDATTTSGVRDSVKTFLDALNNAPGLDSSGSYQVVISSAGRHRNGVQTVAPALWDVKRVNVGRRLDVQRRRANKLSEARITDATLA